jgi:hypothetical protein
VERVLEFLESSMDRKSTWLLIDGTQKGGKSMNMVGLDRAHVCPNKVDVSFVSLVEAWLASASTQCHTPSFLLFERSEGSH